MKNLIIILLTVICASCVGKNVNNKNIQSNSKNIQSATFGMGCFWCGQNKLKYINGIEDSLVGYYYYKDSKTSVKEKNKPVEVSYCKICASKAPNYVEVVQFDFNSNVLSYEDLLKAFFANHKPENLDKQGSNNEDVGFQYKSVIFYHNDQQKEIAYKVLNELNKSKYNGKIQTEIASYDAKNFKVAEWYHQHYWEHHKNLRLTGETKIILNDKVRKSMHVH